MDNYGRGHRKRIYARELKENNIVVVACQDLSFSWYYFQIVVAASEGILKR